MKKAAGTKKTMRKGGSGGAHWIPPLAVLHIDDDPNDSELLRAAARKAGVEFVLQSVEDGDQAMAYLKGLGCYADRRLYPMPSLILLDLKLPRATGFEILKWIRSEPGLGKIPVLVLSGSELREDMQRAYAIGANSYLVKPLGFEALVNMVKGVNAWWTTTDPASLRNP